MYDDDERFSPRGIYSSSLSANDFRAAELRKHSLYSILKIPEQLGLRIWNYETTLVLYSARQESLRSLKYSE